MTLDCQGGRIGNADGERASPSHIDIRSHWDGSTWQPPEGIAIRNCRIFGSIAIYLDAESGKNIIEGNDINIQTGREIIAIDGSAHNRISQNNITLYNRNGIHLYRNCGEKGMVRHQTPSFNIITDNDFIFATRQRPRSVYQNARDEQVRRGRGFYCEQDAGYPFGSSADDRDNATDNTISQNRTRQQGR